MKLLSSLVDMQQLVDGLGKQLLLHGKGHHGDLNKFAGVPLSSDFQKGFGELRVSAVLGDDKNVIVLIVMEGVHFDYLQVADPDVLLEAIRDNEKSLFVSLPGELFVLVDLTCDVDGLLA